MLCNLYEKGSKQGTFLYNSLNFRLEKLFRYCCIFFGMFFFGKGGNAKAS